jgi:hypothetical protein
MYCVDAGVLRKIRISLEQFIKGGNSREHARDQIQLALDLREATALTNMQQLVG